MKLNIFMTLYCPIQRHMKIWILYYFYSILSNIDPIKKLLYIAIVLPYTID